MKLILSKIGLVFFMMMVGCSNHTALNDISVFSTKEEALKDFLEENQGEMLLIETTHGDELIIFIQSNRMYSVYEMINNTEGFGMAKLTSDVDVSNVEGVSWGISTAENHEYTIHVTKEPITGFTDIQKGDYYVSIEKGHNFVEVSQPVENAIEFVEVFGE
ncbi:hypothetical protein [Bacillus sp. FJAT-45037]|uniref:hypothetical protein n=1 Tax=Bacillus sp. FJAT-45037 TaxID=2011007 RepID=UPI000C23E590|nr:hypothetical protein [Bacillus sp. FJAT-45037]